MAASRTPEWAIDQNSFPLPKKPREFSKFRLPEKLQDKEAWGRYNRGEMSDLEKSEFTLLIRRAIISAVDSAVQSRLHEKNMMKLLYRALSMLPQGFNIRNIYVARAKLLGVKVVFQRGGNRKMSGVRQVHRRRSFGPEERITWRRK